MGFRDENEALRRRVVALARELKETRAELTVALGSSGSAHLSEWNRLLNEGNEVVHETLSRVSDRGLKTIAGALRADSPDAEVITDEQKLSMKDLFSEITIEPVQGAGTRLRMQVELESSSALILAAVVLSLSAGALCLFELKLLALGMAVAMCVLLFSQRAANASTNASRVQQRVALFSSLTDIADEHASLRVRADETVEAFEDEGNDDNENDVASVN